jgi:hypothetical protein
MPIIKIVQGSLLDATEEYIEQQCNCVTVKSHGLSQQISDKYPWANVYKRRTQIGSRNCAKDRSTPI